MATAAVLALGSSAAFAQLPIVAATNTPISTDNRPGLFTTTADGHIHFTQHGTGTGWKTEDATALAPGAVAAIPGAPLTSVDDNCFYVAADGHVHQVYWTGSNGWQHADLTALSGAAIANIGSAMAAYVRWDNEMRVYYFSPAGHLEELTKQDNGTPWSSNDLTAASRGPVAVGGSALTAYVVSTGSTDSPRIYYFSSNGHVWEVSYSGGWWANDISGRTGAAPALSGSPMTGFALGATRPRIYYFDASWHVRELAYNSGWRATDLTSLTRTVPAVAGSDLGSMSPANNVVRIYFNSNDGHVREIGYTNNWGASDPSATAGAVPAYMGTKLGVTSAPGTGTQIRIYYLTANSHIEELSYNSGWHINDLN